jgi:RNA polymerase sigma factor (sigma-70 family)
MFNSNERALWLARNVLPHEPALRAWLQKRRVWGLEVDDIIQETYAKLSAVERVDHIRDPKTYTFQIARSVVLTFLRKARVVSVHSMTRLDTLDVAQDDPDPETLAGDRQELRLVGEYIAALPGKIRNVFILRRIEGLSQREVAERLGLAESTVEKHMSKAFQILSISIGRGGKAAPSASKYETTHRRRVRELDEKKRD